MKQAKHIIERLKEAGFEAYMVGGAVRDYLRGTVPHDIDVATSAAPEQVKALFERSIDTGIEHGTVMILIEGQGTEVTTFRTESGYSDNRRPDKVEFVNSLHEDLKRRDFTINSMAMTEQMDIIDPFGGRDDLSAGIIRAVGIPEERFAEDALRMLRAIRFSGQLNFHIDPATKKAIIEHAGRIQSVAMERIKAELDKVMVSAAPRISMRYLIETRLHEFLPSGRLFELDWSGYIADKDPLSGWFYLLHQNNEAFGAIREYRFSNQDKKDLQYALEASHLPLWDDWAYYSFTERQLMIAQAASHKTEAVRERQQALPIHSKSELAANGRDLMEWTGKKAGPWLKEWTLHIEKAVVERRLANDKERIKDWFKDEYHRHT
ncbi:CCA tRNA nucleotidyltransferase [Planococcus sp. CP5-4]|uniref:CCA tRNA nucleotidyltransferase n=1 Tax=unclassified Planococcus (in: firmicutes) TaxID=2662419 RepID=UPI001C22C381|nr:MULTISPECIES: CCA tRNA nucleotidyltransferase [unclassified Planococcus (in: firmicutes)]MBU9671946.1 CCA tRNA nucleotidyltransferase [Planococcus sp. CP5-4_YE]MBV0907509.1 CCA tRNA nucleotidyltransferase [Planococcus sp. CP5-4_UN]MBW6062676.1 CCA tRNA nucleotidyltransferase [Planococcus sp. CP5-4]